MGFVKFVGDVAGGVDSLREAVTKPKRARERAKSAWEAAEQRRQSGLDAAQGLQSRIVAAGVEDEITRQGLPTATEVATTAQDLQLRGKRAENELAQSNTRLTADETRQTLGVAGDEGRQTIGAKASADVARIEGWSGSVPAALQQGLIGPQQQHELAVIDAFTGGVSPMERTERMVNREMDMQQAALESERTDPRRWADLALKAVAAGSLFMT